MALSVVTAVSVFAILEYTAIGRGSILAGGGDTLVHVWYGLIALQSMRGLTSFVKLVDERGPIDIFGKQLS
jgi:DNA-directed RNA polymerase subunit E'/Rpb7